MVSIARKFFLRSGANPAHNQRRTWLPGVEDFTYFGCLTDRMLSVCLSWPLWNELPSSAHESRLAASYKLTHGVHFLAISL